ncbi:7127_t:CDS:2, partial [Racocetra persica]
EFIKEIDSNKSSDSEENIQDDNIVPKGLNPSTKVLNLQQKISAGVKSVEILGTIKRIA